MPRACVIVLYAVGAGALPDASEFGDEGSNTLGNVARAVGGLDLPTLEALGFGNIVEVRAGDLTRVAGLEVTAVPAQHRVGAFGGGRAFG